MKGSTRTMKKLATILASVALLSVGSTSAFATETSYPCSGKGESHKGHHKGDHDHGSKPCDCDSIWTSINAIIKRVTALEHVQASPIPGPEGPAGPMGPRGMTGPPGTPGFTQVKVIREVKTVVKWKTPKIAPLTIQGVTCRFYFRKGTYYPVCTIPPIRIAVPG